MKTIRISCAALALALLPSYMLGGDTSTKTAASKLSAAQIVEKNVAARGGLSVWHGVKTLEMKGKLDAGANSRPTIAAPGVKSGAQMPPRRATEQVQLPFVMELQRGHKMRLEIEFKGQTAVQVYNGTQGWKLRPFLNRHQVENFTPEELQAQASQADLDGYLIDYAAKGEKVELEGVERVEGQDAYNLKVTDSAGHSHHVWIDAANFLEVKIEGVPRRLDGKYHPVATYLRDYRNVGGLMMPYLLETAVEGVKDKEKIQIETIVLNPKLDDSRFAMPR